MSYKLGLGMYDIRTTADFDTWLRKLKDRQAVKAIVLRLTRAEAGNLGDIKSVGGQVSEMRVFVGAGYRLYFTIQGQTIIFMLCGGDKSTQQSDIKTAQAMIANLEYDEVDNNENE